MGTILTMLLGKGAWKAWGGGISAAGAVLADPFLKGLLAGSSQSLEEAGTQIGAAIGAFVLGYVVTWFSPKNKEA